MESEEPEIDVLTSLQGQVIDMTSAAVEMSNRPQSPMAGALPTASDVTTATDPVPVAPVINLVSATPQTSQDAPSGTMTTLHPPLQEPVPSQQCSWSRTPVPPTSPMVTRSQSRGATPAIITKVAPKDECGFKRKSPAGDDIANKKSKRTPGF